MVSAVMWVSARGGRTDDNFGLEIAEKHASGCLIVKTTTGKAKECGIQKQDLICVARDMDLTIDNMHDLNDSTPCDVFTVRHHSDPCLEIPVGSDTGGKAEFDLGLQVKMAKLKLNPNGPSKVINHFIIQRVTADSIASQYPISSGDWIRSINGISLARKELDEVKLLLKGRGRSMLQLCTWSNPSHLSNPPNINKTLAATVVGVIVIALFFRRQAKAETELKKTFDTNQQSDKQEPPEVYRIAPEDEEVVRNLKALDPSTQAKAETELKKIFNDEARSDKEKSDVRSALIHAGMHSIWTKEILTPFLKNQTYSVAALQCLDDRWKDRFIHLCSLITRKKNQLVYATTRQERRNNRAATEAFDSLLEIAKSEFWNRTESIEPDSSEFRDLLDARLLVIDALAYHSHIDYKWQRKAERGGIFDILFKILDKNYYIRLPSFKSTSSVSLVVLECFENFIHNNFRLQTWFKAECDKKHIDLPQQESHVFRLLRPSPNFKHVKELTMFYDELVCENFCLDDISASVSLKGNQQISGTCYAYASARSFIHW
jgi:hypothetical protein